MRYVVKERRDERSGRFYDVIHDSVAANSGHASSRWRGGSSTGASQGSIDEPLSEGADMTTARDDCD